MPQPQSATSQQRARAAFTLGVLGVLILCGCVLLVVWWRGGAPAPPNYGDRPVLRVLLIGNSLTEANDLPTLVKRMSIASGSGPVVEASGRAVPGASLGDHLLAGADYLIEQGDWDFVVLQQGPSSRPESRAMLLESARTYGPMIRAAGAQPAFYMVWPEEAHITSFEDVCESYRLAAVEIDALLLPVGEAWQIAWRLDESIPLYGPDRFHPSPAGSYLAALVICSALTGTSATELAAPGELGSAALSAMPLNEEQVRFLKQAAAESLKSGTGVP